MNQIVIIGNGFDLAHGLKTSYINFILWYFKKAVEKANKNLRYEDDFFGIRYTGVEGLQFNNITDFLAQNSSRITSKSRLFNRITTNLQITNWVDIEREYFNELVAIFNENERLKHEIDYTAIITNEAKKLNNAFNVLTLKLETYLTEIDLTGLEPKESIKDHFDKIISSSKNNTFSNHQNQVYFITFNYTSTLDLYLKQYSESERKLIYIHGILNDPKNPIIFGYGDEMDDSYHEFEKLNSNEFLKNFKSFGYFKTKNYQNLINALNDGAFQVHIMGHSCGLSDRVLFNSIFEHKNCYTIKPYYYQWSETGNDFIEKTMEISRHFSSQGKAVMRRKVLSIDYCVPLIPFSK